MYRFAGSVHGFVVLLVMVLICSSSSLVASENNPLQSKTAVFDQTSSMVRDLPAKIDMIKDDVMRSGGRQGAILWDTYHGVYLSYRPSGYYSILTSYLTGMGFTVEDNSAGLLTLNLDDYDIIVISLGSAWNSAYISAETIAIQSFVSNGGGLIVMTDNVSCPNGNILPVVNAYGVSAGLADIYDSVFTIFAAHPILDGISTLSALMPGEIDAGSPSMEVVWASSGQGFVSVAESGLGRVVIIGDINIWDNNQIGVTDNQLLAANIFEWLAEEPPTATPSPTEIPTLTPTAEPTNTSGPTLTPTPVPPVPATGWTGTAVLMVAFCVLFGFRFRTGRQLPN